ncbi:MAG: Maf family nucleotide pyrophosphatase [Vulcanimicrobiaceae bacterium]
MVVREIILASISPRRFELLRSIGLRVHVVPSAYEEPPLQHLTPRELATVHARAKARDVAARGGELLVVGADTVVDVDGVAYGKPRDEEAAFKMLRALSGRSHVVHTAFTVVDPYHQKEEAAIESTQVTFFPLCDKELRDYIARGECLDKAGGYGIQGFGATLVERVNGDFYTVMGFPVARFVRTLARMGFTL